MGLRPWPAFDAEAAAQVAGIDVDTAGELLGVLADALLLEHTDNGRYRYRPSVRAHAEEMAYRQEGIGGCSAATTRAVDHYLRLSVTAARAALPESWRVPDAPADSLADAYAGRGTPWHASPSNCPTSSKPSPPPRSSASRTRC
ncbi:hypothetical protein V6574_31190 [Streptomyces sp. SM1P]